MSKEMIFNIKDVKTKVTRRQVEVVYDIINYEAISAFLSRNRLYIQSIIKDRKMQMPLSIYKEIKPELSSLVNIVSVLYKATPRDIEESLSYQNNVCEARVRTYATNILGLKNYKYGLDEVSISEPCLYDYGCETEEPFIVTVSYKYHIR